MQFDLRAIDEQQQIQSLTIEALDEADVRQQAAARRITLLSVLPSSRASGREGRFQLLLFAQELHALLVAGLSVIESLATLIEKESAGARRSILTNLSQQLRNGQRLSAALRLQPTTFPALFVGVVQAAEGTSDLPRALARYIDYESRLESVRHKVVSATIYPVVLLGVGFAVSLFLLGYVVPRFAQVYQGSGRALPWASEMLMNWGLFVGRHALKLLAGLSACGAAGWYWARGHLKDGGWWNALRVIPGARGRLEILVLSRLYLTLGMLLEGGITVQQGLVLSAPVLNTRRRAALAQVRTEIESGHPLSDALEQHGLSTPVAARLLRVGEQSGQLGEMLSRTAAFYDGETARWIERFTKAFEPALMGAIGIVIGLIVILLYMPIFDLAGSMP